MKCKNCGHKIRKVITQNRYNEIYEDWKHKIGGQLCKVSVNGLIPCLCKNPEPEKKEEK